MRDCFIIPLLLKITIWDQEAMAQKAISLSRGCLLCLTICLTWDSLSEALRVEDEAAAGLTTALDHLTLQFTPTRQDWPVSMGLRRRTVR